MTEEKNDVIEIKKDSLKQFLMILGASFVGCFLAILLAGQLLKPKAPCCPCHRMCPPPCCMKIHDGGHHKHFAHKHRFKGDWKRKDFDKKFVIEQKKLQDTQAKEVKKVS